MDFLSTVRNKRHYHSQKVRLARCGLARTIYLVEGPLERWPHAGEKRRMGQELSKIEMCDGLLLHLSRGTEDTLRFLGAAAERLRHLLGRCARELELLGSCARGASSRWPSARPSPSRRPLDACCSTSMG